MAESQRWASPQGVASAFTEEQAQRVQALRAAREVCEFKNSAGPLNTPAISVEVDELLTVADWIITGEVIRYEFEEVADDDAGE